MCELCFDSYKTKETFKKLQLSIKITQNIFSHLLRSVIKTIKDFLNYIYEIS